jgi:hypothetical protein
VVEPCRVRPPQEKGKVAQHAEQAVLLPLPVLREPFDVSVARRVSREALVSCEGRQNSIAFAWVVLDVEIVGTAHQVVTRGYG